MEWWETYSKPYEKPKRKKAIAKDNYTLYYENMAVIGNLPYALCVKKRNELILNGSKKELFTIK